MTELTNMIHGDDFPKGPIVFATDDDTRLEVEALKQEVARLNKLRDNMLSLNGGQSALEARTVKLEAFQASSEKPKPRVVDKTARTKIADLQKAIEHLSVKFDNLSARIGVVGTDGYRTKDTVATIVMRQHKLIGRMRTVEAMLGVAVSDG